MRLRHAGEQRRREPEAALGEIAGGLIHHRALLNAARDELADLLELRPGVDRADVRVLVERVADPERPEPHFQLLEQLLEGGLLDQQSRARAAHVALVEEDPVDDALDRLVDRRVLEHDVRGLAAELQREVLARPGDRPTDLLANLG